jgi:hypothetical protein
MKKPKSKFEYQWKAKIIGVRIFKEWGSKGSSDGSAAVRAYLKTRGFKRESMCHIGPGAFIFQMEKKHKHGTTRVVFYLKKLRKRRLVLIDRPSRA